MAKNSVIDLSHWNDANTNLFKRIGIDAVIHKATQGAAATDNTYRNRKEIFVAAGFLWGAYHFGTGSDVQLQVAHYLDTIGNDGNTLMVLDWEENTQGESMSFEQAENFVGLIFEKTGKYPVLYSGVTVKEELAKRKIKKPEQTILSNCPLWISHYAPKPVIPTLWKDWVLWQYTDRFKMQGKNYDRNFFRYGDKELKEFWLNHSI